ncbi:MAG: EamA family transporter [Devosia sp.]
MRRDTPNSNWPGIVAALVSAVLFGLVAPISKLLVSSVDPVTLAGLLYAGAGIGTGVIALVSRWLQPVRAEAGLKRADLPWLASAVLLGGVAGPVLMVLGLKATSASSGSLLLNLEAVATMAIAWVVFRENVDRRLLLGAAAILAGALVVSFQGGMTFDGGGLLVAAACLCWGIDNNLTRNISAADPLQITAIKGLVAGAVNLSLAALLRATWPDAACMTLAGLAGFVGIGLSLVLFVRALRQLGAARTSAYYSVAPFVGALAGLGLFGEPLTPQLVAAGVLMAFGVWLHVSERHVHEHVHPVLEHEHLHVHDIHHQHSHEGPVTVPHSHPHRHEPMRHSHPHYPDLHHRHDH